MFPVHVVHNTTVLCHCLPEAQTYSVDVGTNNFGVKKSGSVAWDCHEKMALVWGREGMSKWLRRWFLRSQTRNHLTWPYLVLSTLILFAFAKSARVHVPLILRLKAWISSGFQNFLFMGDVLCHGISFLGLKQTHAHNEHTDRKFKRSLLSVLRQQKAVLGTVLCRNLCSYRKKWRVVQQFSKYAAHRPENRKYFPLTHNCKLYPLTPKSERKARQQK